MYNPDKSAVGQALFAVSSHCDRARTLDGQGFSRHDAQFGNDIALKWSVSGGFVTVRQFEAARRLAIKYRKQAAEAGVPYEAIRDEKFVAVERPPETTYLVRAQVVGGSERATKIVFQGRSVWLPDSQIKARQADGADTIFTLPAWIVAEKGLQGEAAQG